MNQTCPMQFVGGGLAHVLSDVLQPASQTIVAGTLYSVYMGLFTAWPGFNLSLLLSQLTEAGYNGYARQKITWGDEGTDKTLRPEVLGGIAQFQPSSSGVSSTVIGAFIADASTGGNLILAGLFPQQVVLATPADLLGVIARFAVPGTLNPDWGEIVSMF